jgi:hypothetical protein
MNSKKQFTPARREALRLALLVGLFLLVPRLALSATYYVSCNGNDSNDGTSTSTPWATLAKASSQAYSPGDQVLLQDGCVWVGTFQPTVSGSSGNPITFSNYGSGALPRIVGNDAPAVYLLNVSYWTIQNVDLSQKGQTPQALDSGNQHGKDNDQHADLYMWAVLEIRALSSSSTCASTCTVNNITVQHTVIHDGQWIGLFAEGGYYNSGDNGTGYINNLLIQNNEVRGNQAAGIQTEATFLGQTNFNDSNVQFLNNYVHNNAGDGIVFSQTNGGLSQGNRTSYNGRVRNARVGNWTWNAQDVNIQFNESDHNMTPLSDFGDTHARDGGGFDMDLGTINSYVQYNYSHDNYGEGTLVLTWPVGYGYSCCTTENATVRYNTYERDAEKQAGAITVFGGVDPGYIYGNTCYNVAARPSGTGAFNGTGGCLTSSIYAKSGNPILYVYNNNFISDGNVHPSDQDTIVWGDGKGTFYFENNSYFDLSGHLNWTWGRSTYTTLAGWRGLGFDSAGMAPSSLQLYGTIGNGPSAYQLGSTSPLVDTAADVSNTVYGGMGTRDYFGTSIPQGCCYDIGAGEYSGTYSSMNSPATPVAHTSFSPSIHVDAITMNTPTVSKNGTASWTIAIKDANGNPVSGIPVTVWLLNQSWNSIDYSATANTNSSGVASFSTNATSSTGTYFMMLPYVDTSLTSDYYDSYQNNAWTTYFTVQ